LLVEINKNPHVKQADLSKILNVSRGTVQRMIKEKTDAGILKRKGGKRYGYWEDRLRPAVTCFLTRLRLKYNQITN
jgi:predicted transcriptional regulator